MKAAGAYRAPFATMTVTREVPVAIERAFRGWIRSRLLARWLVPDGGTASSVTANPCVGGHCRIEGFLSDGTPFAIGGVYLLVDEPTKLAMSWFYVGPAGPLRDEASIVTAAFTALGPKLTGVTVTHERTNRQDDVEHPQPPIDQPVKTGTTNLPSQ